MALSLACMPDSPLSCVSSERSFPLIVDPEILAIPIVENQDPLIDVREEGGLSIGSSPEIPNNQDYTFMRKAVYDWLIAAQKLLPPGLRFELYEGYRSLKLQKILFENRRANIRGMYPQWSEAQIFQETTKMVSPVINLDGSRNVPPHNTGAAIDVYLIDETGEPLDMGIHPKDAWVDKDGALSETTSPSISAEAQKNRAIMSAVLSQVGFINYPTEYWHWSYGDRYWAYHAGAETALYGSLSDRKVMRKGE